MEINITMEKRLLEISRKKNLSVVWSDITKLLVVRHSGRSGTKRGKEPFKGV